MADLAAFIDTFKSVVLSTVDSKDNPFASYAPFTRYEHRYYIFISDIARHAANLKNHPKAALFFIEDESLCDNIFARKRAVLQCRSKIVERKSTAFDPVMQAFKARFDPDMLDMLLRMKDFNLYELAPFEGEAVFGFGKAYDVGGETMDRLLERENSGGHQKK